MSEREIYDIGKEIWTRKYKYHGSQECPEDKTPDDTFRRVAKSAASVEKDPEYWEEQFYQAMKDYKFMPGGRILANGGTSRTEVTMFNCFVMNTIPDSIEGIFETVKESALTQKQGGGVGFDFSTIRPRGNSIKGCEAAASGPLSFMQVLDATCRTIMSAGQRRGAQMGILRCDHPDIEAFITAKRENAALQMFNLSVAVTDDFLKAVRDGADWQLMFVGKVYKTIKAQELWELIMKSTYNYAEPGFILFDRINRMNNLYYCENICATNPCGEQPLPPYGACLLGSVNLSRFVKNPFEDNASIDFELISGTVKTAVRLLDNVIGISKYPLEAQKREAMSKRRMGIGITGLADLFLFMKVRYGSSESADLAKKIMQTITYSAYEASVELAKEKGAFKMFDAEKYCAGNFIKTLPKKLQEDIRKYGIRNSHLTSVAPTGTISLLAGNVSSGLEPVFAFSYVRKVLNGTEADGATEYDVADYAYEKYIKKFPKHDKLPDYFVESGSITPDEHLAIQAALQEFVDSSISKTINVPTDFPYEDFKQIYMKAAALGLKGCTTFRPSEHFTGVLVKKEEKKAEVKKAEAEKKPVPIVIQRPQPARRPRELEGITYKIKTPLAADALYLTINDIIEEDGRRHPYELFINTKNLQYFSWIVAMTRLISAVFRHDPAPTFLVEELKSIYDPNGGYFSEGTYIPSLAADIGRVIERHLARIGIIHGKAPAGVVVPAPHTAGGQQTSASASAPASSSASSAPGTQAHSHGHASGGDSNMMICPQCNEKKLVMQENCMKCLSCGYGKCS